MSTAVKTSANNASGTRDASRRAPAPAGLRRAPVLLRLPALHPPQPAEEAEDHSRRRFDPPPKVEREPERPHLEVQPEEEAERSEPHGQDSQEGHSRRSRSSRRQPRSEAPKKAGLSQWILGGCMLTAGILGFFAISGDFGEGSGEAPPVDGWAQRADDPTPAQPEFTPPELANAQEVTVRRETVPQEDRNYSNPAEGTIGQAPAPTAVQPPTNFMGGGATIPETVKSDSPGTPGERSDATPDVARASAPESRPEIPLSAPQNPPGGPAAPANPYPTTGATGLSPFAAPVAPTAQSAYPSTGFNSGPTTYSPPAARTGMNDSSFPAAYPSTGAAPSAYPNTASPPAMSPRYERIR